MKKTIYLIVISALAGAQALMAQNTIQDVLMAIESNNPALKESAREAELQKLENRATGILENPEVEFNYLWGQNAEVGMRHDLTVTQSFDIPTLTGMRSRQTTGLNAQADLKYKADRLDVLLEASLICIDVIYCNRLLDELSSHLKNAETLTAVTLRKMELGEADVMETNKARLHLASIQGKISRTEVERERLLAELKTLNGGEPVSLDAMSYGAEDLPEEFDAWYEAAASQNPVLQYVRKEVDLSTNGLRIDKTMTLPNLTVGYMSEIGMEEKYRGLTLGIAIPLWSNSNRIRQSKARLELARTRQARAEQEFYDKLLREFNEARNLKSLADSQRAALEQADNREHLISAQTKGEISMIDYIVETDLYYEFLEELLSSERDYRKSLAELNSVTL